ncbi:MAG: DNA gyrase inhibitor YacG [Acidobacteria bacterium]|nr:MAG: DNA gyrase inhibitor YacG [Acidobacteriota bacterium]
MKCPTCGKPTNWQDNPFRPFCSERCKLVDFGRWVNEEYRVPDERPPEQTDVPAHTPDSDGDV